MAEPLEFDSFESFYPFYISQHSKAATRAFHAVGTGLGIANLVKSLAFGPRKQVVLTPVVSYGFAWFSHFVIEGNKPATFGHPLYSLRGDFTMLYDMARGRNAELQEMADEYLAMMAVRELADEAAIAFEDHPVHTPSPAEESAAEPSSTPHPHTAVEYEAAAPESESVSTESVSTESVSSSSNGSSPYTG